MAHRYNCGDAAALRQLGSKDGERRAIQWHWQSPSASVPIRHGESNSERRSPPVPSPSGGQNQGGVRSYVNTLCNDVPISTRHSRPHGSSIHAHGTVSCSRDKTWFVHGVLHVHSWHRAPSAKKHRGAPRSSEPRGWPAKPKLFPLPAGLYCPQAHPHSHTHTPRSFALGPGCAEHRTAPR
jgi:hypothetical protein